MEIIKAKEDQYEAVRDFYYSMIDAMVFEPFSVGWKKDIYPDPEFMEGSIRNGEMYLAVEDGGIVGAMVVNHECNDGYEAVRWQIEAEKAEVVLIHALGIHPRYFRRGFGRAMVQKVIDLARESGMRAIRLDVLDGNYPAEKLYKGFGF